MSVAAPLDHRKPFAGWVVRLIHAPSWKDDAIVNVLRRYGAKVVYRDTRTTTHIVTCHAPPEPGGTSKWMSPAMFSEYVRAVSYAANAGRPAQRWSYAQITDTLDQMHEDRRQRKQAAQDALYVPLERGDSELPGFVGV